MRDYWVLVRPRILALVLVTVGVSAFSTAEYPFPHRALLHAVVGTGLLTAGALALNQWWEVHSDSQMARTAPRPLPAGRVSSRRGGWFGLGLSLLGMGYLAVAHGGTALLAVAGAGWLAYLCAYTPLKTRTPWQTPVGAAAGAIPVLIGAAAVDTLKSPLAWNLFGILYSWQLPHAMAVAWLYRQQFAAAGIKLAPVVDPGGRSAGTLACAAAAATWMLGIVPAVLFSAGWGYAIASFVLGLGYFATALWFAMRTDERAARWLLRASLIYLCLLLAALTASKIPWA